MIRNYYVSISKLIWIWNGNFHYKLTTSNDDLVSKLFVPFALGNVKNWWDSKSNKKFKQKAQCMIWQYGNYTSNQVELPIDGKYTLSENIADNGGIKASYQAYGMFDVKNCNENQEIVCFY